MTTGESDGEPGTTYRYVADGPPGRGPTRQRVALFTRPVVLGGYVVAWLVFGVAASFLTYASFLPQYTARIVWIGLFWGLVFAIGGGALLAAMLWWLVRREQAKLARLFAPGSVTEVTVDEYGLEITRPSGRRRLGFAEVSSVRTSEPYLLVVARKRPYAEVLPVALFPDSVVELLRARSHGVWPAPPATPPGENVRRFVVPDGWASHAARVYLRVVLRRPRSWRRVSVVVALLLLAAYFFSPVWALWVPVLLTLLVLSTYYPTRRNLALAAPPGSLATTVFLDDHFISRNAGGAREIRYADVRSAQVHGDLVLYVVEGGPPRLMPRALMPDDVLERFGTP